LSVSYLAYLLSLKMPPKCLLISNALQAIISKKIERFIATALGE
jgi:hypothetical protein